MDKGAKVIVFKKEKAARQFAKTHLLTKNLKRALLVRRAELLEDEYEEILIKLEEE